MDPETSATDDGDFVLPSAARRAAEFLSAFWDDLIKDFSADKVENMVAAATPVVIEHALKGNL